MASHGGNGGSGRHRAATFLNMTEVLRRACGCGLTIDLLKAASAAACRQVQVRSTNPFYILGPTKIRIDLLAVALTVERGRRMAMVDVARSLLGLQAPGFCEVGRFLIEYYLLL